MNLISSQETLDFLSKSAPRPWIKRMLLWMIFNQELEPLFREGKSVETARAYQLVWEVAHPGIQGEERARLIKEAYDESLAEKLLSANDLDLFENVACEWKVEDGVRPVASGYFVCASSINWENGDVSAEINAGMLGNDLVFWEEDELLQGQFEKADYSVTLRGLCFEREKIEMLQPHFEIAASTPGTAAAPIGRPRIWDWDGATTHLLTVAQTPDGLPTGPGAQAQIERLLADWFLKTVGKEPAESLIRKHATKIMRALRKPENQ